MRRGRTRRTCAASAAESLRTGPVVGRIIGVFRAAARGQPSLIHFEGADRGHVARADIARGPAWCHARAAEQRRVIADAHLADVRRPQRPRGRRGERGERGGLRIVGSGRAARRKRGVPAADKDDVCPRMRRAPPGW